MSFITNIIPKDYFEIKKNGISPFQNMAAYLGGSAFQTIVDNPVTAYRQLVQQYAKDINGNIVDPKIAVREANKIFYKHPISISLSGLTPRIIGIGFKRIPKFGFLLGISYFTEKDGNVGMIAATGASILSAPFINPIRMIEKQQRAYFRETNNKKSISSILYESKKYNFKPLFRGTLPLMGHSLASATTGLVGQPQLQIYIHKQLNDKTYFSQFTSSLIASSIVSPIYVIMTNPLSRLEVIMQTSNINHKSIKLYDALKEIINDSKSFGIRGIFRGQGIGIFKAIISLTMFHEGRLYLTDQFKNYNINNHFY